MNNVRCAGGVTVGNHPQTGDLYPDEGCGWKGERLAKVSMYSSITYRDILAKPCPRCGGRVQLISDEVRS